MDDARRWLVGLAVTLAGCSSASAPTLDGTWQYQESNVEARGVTFTSDGAYVGSSLVLTGPASGEASVEKGTFQTSGNQIKFTPTETSCAVSSDPPYVLNYTLTSTTLELSSSSGVTVYTLDTAAEGNFSLSTGCFEPDAGTFSPMPLAPIP